MNPICIIAARAGSKRLPGKNKADLGGWPIITYPIKAALESNLFSEVDVSSDDHEILQIAHDAGAFPVNRPAELAGDTVDETGAWLHVLQQIVDDNQELPEYFCAIYPTAAFVTAFDLRASFIQLKNSNADAVIGVTRYEQHPYRMIRKRSKNAFYERAFPVLNETDSHAFPRAYACNGTLFWFRTAAFYTNPTHWQANLDVYETYAVDIDTPEDLERAREQFVGIPRLKYELKEKR